MYSPKLLLAAATVIARTVAQDQCPGYVASNVQETSNRLTASLQLAGEACNLYGTDLPNLTLTVEYQTDTRIHVLIEDLEQNVYQVPEEIVPRPQSGSASSDTSELKFSYVQSPFSFAVSRSNGEVLFNTSGWPLIFESQYLGLRTSLPESPSLYGLGEHMDPFQLNTTNYTRTLWSRDAYGIPPGTNLYGNHPVYLDNRAENGTHGVLLLNSNGMDIKINDTDGQYLEYNVIGGVIDLYFVAGPSPVEASQQLSEVVGKPAMIPYWSLGYHNCRYGYRDVYQVAEVVYNYSMAGVPLEVMWTDIDYMLLRRVFTLDPERFPLSKMRELVGHLHEAGQHYIVMVDPAVAYQDYDAYNNGLDLDVWLKYDNGTLYQGAVWPGPTVFPDWFHPNITEYWNSEFASFFSAESGVDIDGLWIDMNEAANFCPYPCLDPQGFANESGNPPDPPPVRDGPAIPLPGFPADLQPGASNLTRRQSQTKLGLPDRELIDPPYMIQNAAGSLSNKTINTDLHHHNGLTEYDTHNFYGSMMSVASRTAMLARRPDVRPLVITRSTFLVSQPMSPPAQNRSDPVRYENINRSPFPLFAAFFSVYMNNHLINVPNGMQLTAVQGAGTAVGHWTGDNAATWEQYHLSISDMLNFNSIFHIPMVGSDICGFSGNTTETLCARWAMLGAFYPFMRNHNADNSIPQEFYRWPSVAAAARYAIDIRYRLLDYFYTAFYLQTTTGTPSLNPLWFLYPNDTNTFANYGQFFFGDAVLVSPVLEENSTSVDIYVPQDVFYDVNDGFKPVKGSGEVVTLDDVGFQTIPLHVRGGTVVPLRMRDGANTTAELRTRNFEVVVAPGIDGSAKGSLYLDDGASLQQQGTTFVNFTYSAGDGTFSMIGEYGYDAAGVEVERLLVLGVGAQPGNVTLQGGSQGALPYTYDAETQVVSVSVTIPLTMDATVSIVAG